MQAVPWAMLAVAGLLHADFGASEMGRTGRVAELLPDLVALAPTDFTLQAPDGGASGCKPGELERGAIRCLRFTSWILNAGDGALDLSAPDGDPDFLVQRVQRSDGSWVVRRAGSAQFHAEHGHYHYLNMVGFTLRPVDAATGEVGGLAAAGGKTGFCLYDQRAPADPPESRHYFRWDCRHLKSAGAAMGLTPGWIDRYRSSLDDQFLEVSGIADGFYQFTVVIDPLGTLLDAKRSNNGIAVLLQLQGGAVVVLDELPAPAVSAAVAATPPTALHLKPGRTDTSRKGSRRLRR